MKNYYIEALEIMGLVTPAEFASVGEAIAHVKQLAFNEDKTYLLSELDSNGEIGRVGVATSGGYWKEL